MSQVRGTFSFSSSFIDVQVDPYIHAESSSTHTSRAGSIPSPGGTMKLTSLISSSCLVALQ